jgi:hypothetical protein
MKAKVKEKRSDILDKIDAPMLVVWKTRGEMTQHVRQQMGLGGDTGGCRRQGLEHPQEGF